MHHVPSPAVSVVIPLYNKRRTVERTIDSVLAQSLGDFELIIVDDGSSDGGAELVEARYNDPRLRVFRQPNAGPGAARNRGLALSAGEFVTFLDADDVWMPQLLARAVSKLREHPECGAFTSSFILEPAGVDRWSALQAFGFSEGSYRLTPQTPRRELRHCLDAFNNTNAVYRRAVAIQAGGFYTEQKCTFGEDVYFWMKVLLNHPIYRCMEPLARYHTEDSDLGIGARSGSLPIEPILTNPDPVRAVCPDDLSRVFELWLAHHAVRAAFMQLDSGSAQNASWLLESFPRMRSWPLEYLKLRLRLSFPGVWNFARHLQQGGGSKSPALR